MTSGLRERRKQETRLAISDTATRMFAEAGFDAVTITQVADAAGVAKMTVTNYFPRKEDLVFDRAGQMVRGLAEAVAARAPGESLLTAVRRDYAQAVARREVTLGLSGAAFARMVDSSPVLQARLREILDQRERALADAIVAETGSEDVLARVVAAALASVHRVLYAEASRRSLGGESREQIATVLAAAAERAFGLLEPSLGGYCLREAGEAGEGAPGRP
jgi:AcrR family transcriptional regulator